jgi:hypothetical protein
MNPVPMFPSYSCKIHSNVIHPHMPRSSKWFLTNILHAFLISPMYATSTANFTLLHLITLITCSEEYKLRSSSSRNLLPLRSKYSLQHLVLKHPQSMYLSYGRPSCIKLILNILGGREED